MADFHAAISVMRVLRHHIAATISLSSAEWSVLLAVWTLEPRGWVTVRAIADHLHVAGAHVTSEVGKLVERGLVTKTPHPTDGRSIGVNLTRSAKAVFKTASPMLREVNDRLLADVLYRDLVAVQRFFRTLIEHGQDAVRVAQSYATGGEKRQKGRAR